MHPVTVIILIFLNLLAISTAFTWPILPQNFTTPSKQWSPGDGNKIVGGEETDIEKYPFQVAILNDGRLFCGGSLLTEDRVLTAAHCTDGRTASELSIRAGSSFHNKDGIIVNVIDIRQHPNYTELTVDNDISILVLESGVLQPGPTIDFVTYPTLGLGNDPSTGAECIITGWGTTTEGGSISEKLQVAEVPIVSRSDCETAYGSSEITKNMICAGIPKIGGIDTCQGDSGGGLLLKESLVKHHQVGIVSWGYGCARPDYPGVYTKVANYKDFIEENIK